MLIKNLFILFAVISTTLAHSTNENIRYSNHYEQNEPKTASKSASIAEKHDCPSFEVVYNKPSTGFEYGYKPEVFGNYSIVNGTLINNKKFYMAENEKFG